MNVVDGLATLIVAIEDVAEAGVNYPLVVCDCIGAQEEAAEEFCVFFGCVRDALDMFARYDEDVCWCGGINVMKGEEVVILIYFLRGNPAARDLAE